MIIAVIVILIGLFLGFAILVASGVVASQSWAKKQARKMLDAGMVDAKTVDRVLKVLSATKDNEGTRLYNDLYDLKRGVQPIKKDVSYKDTQIYKITH